jgi:peptide chain release factor 1
VTTRRGDPLLERAHLVGQVGLVAHRGGHPAEQRGDLGAGLREPEDVVDEQQHVLALHVAEVLRHRQRGQRDPQPGARRLVHLAEDQRGLADDAGVLHLLDQVVALAGALAHPGEHGHTAVVLGDAGDHLLDQHGLADAGPAEQADLAALDVRREQVDDLDAGLEHLGLRLQLVEGGRLAVDAPALLDVELLALLEVQALAEGVEDVAERRVADRHRDRAAGVGHLGTADQAVGGLQGDRADHAVTDVLGHLQRERALLARELELGL